MKVIESIVGLLIGALLVAALVAPAFGLLMG